MNTVKGWLRTKPKLTAQQVADIREMRGRKVSYRSLAIKYGVHENTIRDAALGEGAYRGT